MGVTSLLKSVIAAPIPRHWGELVDAAEPFIQSRRQFSSSVE